MAVRTDVLRTGPGVLVFLVLASLLLPTDSHAAERGLVDDFWERSEMEPEPSLGGVLRADFDNDGDGRTDLLLANAQRMGSSGVTEWYVYLATASDNRFQCVGAVPSSPKSFRVVGRPPRFEVLSFMRSEDDELQASIDTYGVSATGISLLSTKPLDDTATEATRKSIEDWRKAARFRILSAGLDAQGRFVNPTWTEFKSDKPAEGVTSLEGLVVVQ